MDEKKKAALRRSPRFDVEAELVGHIKPTVAVKILDISEHGMYGYPEQFIEVPGAFPESTRHSAGMASLARPSTIAVLPVPASPATR